MEIRENIEGREGMHSYEIVQTLKRLLKTSNREDIFEKINALMLENPRKFASALSMRQFNSKTELDKLELLSNEWKKVDPKYELINFIIRKELEETTTKRDKT